MGHTKQTSSKAATVASKDPQRNRNQGAGEKRSGLRARSETRQEEPRLVLVEWEDSYGCSASWVSVEGNPPSTLLCRSVGWLIHDRDDCKVIVPHLTIPNTAVQQQGCGDMTIPAKAIIRVTPLSATRR